MRDNNALFMCSKPHWLQDPTKRHPGAKPVGFMPYVPSENSSPGMHWMHGLGTRVALQVCVRSHILCDPAQWLHYSVES